MSSQKIIILTAPSGSGKTTIAKFLLAEFDQLSFSVSATTRMPRDYEQNGVHYFFYSELEFKQLVKENKLLEYQEVYPNQFYGTLYSELERIWSDDKIALFDIDVKGAFNLIQNPKLDILSVFIKTSSIEVLRKRLIARGTETEESLAKRILKASEELEYSKHFEYVITNDKLELAQKLVKTLVEDFITN
ncbi:MAG TPA: guanylate kinase [Saprospiraceae bacterium]|nr:guanylate kinase [Saprospiraceae bacterium]